MAITIFDPDERKRNNQLAFLQSLQTAGSLAGTFGALQKSKQEAQLAKQQATLLSQFLPQLQGNLPGQVPSAPSGSLPQSNIGFKGFSIGPSGLSMDFGQTPQQKTEEEQRGKSIEQSTKLSTAVRRLALINKQFKDALPSGDKTPLEQRIAGTMQTIGAKYGLVDNPKLLALKKNIRPMAINMVRMFGEVGNLSQSEQQGAIDVVSQEGLTDDERIASVRQFAEYALAGADQDALNYMLKQKDIQGIIDAFGIDVGQGESGSGDQLPPSLQKALQGSGVKVKSFKRIS